MAKLKKKFKKTSAKLTKFEKRFAAQYVKKGGLPEYKRVLRARWWIGKLGSRR